MLDKRRIDEIVSFNQKTVKNLDSICSSKSYLKEHSKQEGITTSEVTRSFASKDIFRKKLKSKSKQCLHEDAIYSRDKRKKSIIDVSLTKPDMAMIRSNSLKQAINLMNNSTMSSLAGKKPGESNTPFKFQDMLNNRSLEKFHAKDRSLKKSSNPLRLYQSLSNFTALKRKSNPALSMSFSKKSLLILKDKLKPNSLQVSRSHIALIAKELLSNLNKKKIKKIQNQSTSQSKLKTCKSVDREMETIEQNHRTILVKMAEFKSKLNKVVGQHLKMKRIIDNINN